MVWNDKRFEERLVRITEAVNKLDWEVFPVYTEFPRGYSRFRRLEMKVDAIMEHFGIGFEKVPAQDEKLRVVASSKK